MSAVDLGIADARRLALDAQGLLGAVERRGRARDRVVAVVRRLGAVQLDTISVLARSHELVAFARSGAVGRAAVESAYWGAPHDCVEYWSHAASVIPLEDWPWYAWRRRRERHGLAASAAARTARAEVLARLRDLGPVTVEQLGGSRRGGGPWWDWSPLKVAVEQLLAAGEVVCRERRGWRRVYDLAERALPPELRGDEPSDAECHSHLLAGAARRLGVATAGDLADYPRLRLTEARAAVAAAGLVEVRVEGWREPAYADPAVLEAAGGVRPRRRSRTVLLSPFDSLVWSRHRTERLFGFAHRFEAYVPAALRHHGYFTMPLLHGGRLAGFVDPRRAGRTLVAANAAVERRAAGGLAVALVEAATWVGCDDVRVERLDPPELAPALDAELRRLLG